MNCLREEFDDLRPAQSAASIDAWADLAKHLRRRRSSIFGADLFNDPAWDIILLLAHSSNSSGLTLSIISAQIDRSEESSRRWLEILVERGHVEKDGPKTYRLAAITRHGLTQLIPSGNIESAEGKLISALG
jgi:hypothetical protein